MRPPGQVAWRRTGSRWRQRKTSTPAIVAAAACTCRRWPESRSPALRRKANHGMMKLRSTPDSLASICVPTGFEVADRPGFEPRTALRLYGISSAAPSTGLGHLSPLGKSTHALTPLPPRATLRRPMRERGSVWRGLLSAPFIAIAVLAPLATAFGLGL